jgi:branched-chain amino acid aminotransferase
MPELLWTDGRIIAPDQATVAAFDRGLLYGDGLFETLLGLGERVPFLDRHLARLFDSADALGIRPPLQPGAVADAVHTLAARAAEPQLYLRITLTRGVGGKPSDLHVGPGTLIIWARPFDGYPERLYEDGMSAIVASVRRNQLSLLSRHKTLNYLDSVLAKAEAAEHDADEAILLNTDGHIAEAATANLFIVTGDGLLTPPLQDGPLPGIVRGVLIKVAGQLDIPCKARSLTSEDLAAADEALLTNSLMGVMPLCRFGSVPIGSGRPGPMTSRLRQTYVRMLYMP